MSLCSRYGNRNWKMVMVMEFQRVEWSRNERGDEMCMICMSWEFGNSLQNSAE